MSLLPQHDHLLVAQDSHQANFRAWAGTDIPEIWGPDLFNYDFSQPGPHIARVFHGTTHRFSSFNAAERASPTGAFGRVNYFTSCDHDAQVHYARVGPDLENRIEREAGNINYEIFCNPEDFGLDCNADESMLDARALEIARERLDGGEEILMEVFLRFDRPFVIGSANPYKYMLFDDHECIYDAALKQVIEDHDLEPEMEVDDLPCHLRERYDEACHELSDKHFDELQCAMMRAARRLKVPLPDLPDAIFSDGLEITHDAFDRALGDTPAFYELEDLEGNFVLGDFLAKTVEELGYDAIVLMDAGKRFNSMDLAPGTTHIHIFDSGKNRIKSARNPGIFDPHSSNIFA